MARSVWKGPFVEESLMKKVDKYKVDPKKIPIKTWSRKSTILPDFVGVSFQILFQKIWLVINWENFHLLELFMDTHLLIKKRNQQQRLKNNYEQD